MRCTDHLNGRAVLDCNSAHIKAIARVGEEAIGGMIFGKKLLYALILAVKVVYLQYLSKNSELWKQGN